MNYPIKELASRWALNEILLPNTIGVELGVWEGDHAEELFRSVKPKELHLIDYWRLSPEKPGEGLDNWKHVKARFDSRIAEGLVSLHEGSFADVLKRFPDRFFDWGYVDGYHGYEAVSRDIADLLPKIKIGGVLCGHDFDINPSDWRTGVPRAVIEAVQNGVGPMIALSNARFGDWAIRVGGFGDRWRCNICGGLVQFDGTPPASADKPEPGKGENG